ncbi:MAG: hypothetical protein JWQ97_1253 [Phenylobacterium sp.]|nr:hypothetical protein [Phenylobacterium sp.]
MTPFSATEAGLEGFRITRENPKAFALWVTFSFLVSVLGAIVTVSMPAEVRTALETLRADQTPDAHQLLEALIAAAPLLVFGLTIQCVMAAAVYRIIFRHDDVRFGYLRLGLDELRLMALTLLFLLLVIGLLVVVTVAAGLVMAVVSAAGAPLAIFIGAVVELFAIGLVVHILVRLSLAPVITFAERRIALFESWKLTHGHFWRLFLAYLLAAFCIVLITLLALILFVTLAFIYLTITGGSYSDISAIMHPDETAYSSYFNPGMIAYMLVGSVITALWYAVIAAPGAWAYLKLHGDPPAGH